jgi:hypothetical protein
VVKKIKVLTLATIALTLPLLASPASTNTKLVTLKNGTTAPQERVKEIQQGLRRIDSVSSFMLVIACKKARDNNNVVFSALSDPYLARIAPKFEMNGLSDDFMIDQETRNIILAIYPASHSLKSHMPQDPVKHWYNI